MISTLTTSRPRGRVFAPAWWILAALFCAPFGQAQFIVPLSHEQWLGQGDDVPDTWLDRTHFRLHQFVSNSARRLDSLAGPPKDDGVYQQASGSVAVAVLWDEFNGLRPRARFRVDLPLPQINERLHLFVGRVNREEYVTERALPSGAFPRYRSDMDDEQTLAGIVFLPSRALGGDFDGSVGARVKSSFDPYVKVGYRYRRLLAEDTRLTINETVFWQKSEGFGLTSRIDLERILAENWHMRWTGSGTIAEHSLGLRGYSTLTFTWAMPRRQAMIFQLGLEGESQAEVPVEDIGVKVAYRRSIVRDWLVLELRSSVTWPKELPEQPRKPSWGVGIGCEVFFGTEEFSVRPVTL